MSAITNSAAGVKTGFRFDGEIRHSIRLYACWIATLSVIVWVAVRGFPYYRLDAVSRAYSPDHALFRPSGTIGLRMGLLGLGFFLVLFLYPIRKRWPWLGRIGKTRHWLDFHVMVGITAPVLVTLHSSFKVRGLAGVAYWIMMAVALSGFVGRYLYAQIPRSLSASELTMRDLQSLSGGLAVLLERQTVLKWEDVAPLLRVPTTEEVESMSLGRTFMTMLVLDITRPFRVSRLRRGFLSGRELVLTVGGLLRTRHLDLEAAISAVRSQSWLSAKMAFLRRIQEVFHLWHVVHRPFSYSFAVLVVVHIGIALMLGYY